MAVVAAVYIRLLLGNAVAIDALASSRRHRPTPDPFPRTFKPELPSRTSRMDYYTPKPTGSGIGKALLVVGWLLFALSTTTAILRFYTKGYRLRRGFDMSDWCIAGATVGIRSDDRSCIGESS